MSYSRLWRALAIAALLTLGGCAGQAAHPAAGDAQSAPDNDALHLQKLQQAQSLIHQQKPEEALVPLQAVIDDFEAQYSLPGRRVYSSRSPSETLLYLSTAAKDGVDAVAVPPAWFMAQYLKGYALVELNRLDDARASLEAANKLAPSNSMALSELGYIQQLEKNWDEAIKLYTEAEHASSFSPESEAKAELGRALRGQGYALTEQGHLDEAEARYQRCLEVNPDDAIAKNELRYLAQLRARQT